MSTIPPTADFPAVPSPPASRGDDEKTRSIFLVSYPKVVFLYPTFLMALISGFYTLIAKAGPEDSHVVSSIFLLVFGLNLVVFSFDFPRTTSLTLFFCITAVLFGVLLLFRLNTQILPFVTDVLRAFQPYANATFYFSIAGILGLIYVGVLINVQFDYWEVTPNELLHHHGFLANLERFSAPSLKIDKEITDVFEYALLRSGRLILHPSAEPRAIVLEHVPRINTKQDKLTRMLGALQVQLRPPAAGE